MQITNDNTQTLIQNSRKKACILGMITSFTLVAIYIRLYYREYKDYIHLTSLVLLSFAILWACIGLSAYCIMLYKHYCIKCNHYWCYIKTNQFITSKSHTKKNIIGIKLEICTEKSIEEFRCNNCEHSKCVKKIRWHFKQYKRQRKI